MPGYILTGAPGAGKTAVLRLLEVNGHVVVEEAATDTIALDHALGHGQPWHDHTFIYRIVTLQRSGGTPCQQARPRPSSSTAHRCALWR
jgi:predicted ATPase